MPQAQQRRDLLAVFAHAPMGVALLREPDHQLDYWNDLFTELFPGAQVGVPVQAALPDLATMEVLYQLDRLYKSGETYQGPVTRLPGPGPARYVTFTYQPYREQEQIAGVALFIQDVTAVELARQHVQQLNENLRTTNQDLYASNAQLKRTNADLDAFIYTASHDLRSPITNIEGLMDALRQELMEGPPGTPAPAVEHILGLIDNSIARFQITIGQLTDMMRLQQGGSTPLAGPVDLAALVEDVRLDLAADIARDQAQLRVDVAQCPIWNVATMTLRSIVFNLLSNAIKYRAPERPPVIALHATCNAHWATLRVQDNGLGLNTEQQGKLFHLFGRLHTHVEGSGVGLYSIKKLVENAGGSIEVISELGVGTVFTVRLPIVPA